jgi:ABC-type transport system involved in cytochrome bd biosynthesis fused ATPase/permease subunit
MRPKELLSDVPGIRRRYAIGVALSLLGSIALIAWTIALAESISAFVVQKPPVAAIVALAGTLVLRVAFRFTSSQSLANASSQVRAGVRGALLSRWSGNQELLTSAGVDSTLLGPGVDALDDYVTKFLPARFVATVIPVVVFLTIGILDPWS